MTSTTLLNKNFWSVLKYQLKNAKVLLIIIPIITLLCCSFGNFVTQLSYYDSEDYYEYSYEDVSSGIEKAQKAVITDVSDEYISSVTVTVGMMLVVVAVAMALSFYKTLYSKRKMDFFGALPITRQTEYLCKTITAFSVFLEAYLMMIASAVVFNLTAPQRNSIKAMLDVPYCIRAFTVVIICAMALYCIVQVCAVVAGKTWQYLLLTIGMLSYVPNIIAVPFMLPSQLLAGAAHSSSDIPSLLSPITSFSLLLMGAYRYRYIILAMVIVGIIAFVFGAWLYAGRKSECAEQSVSSDLVISLVILGVQVTVFSMAAISGMTPSKYMLIAAIGCVLAIIATLICSLIYKKRAFTKAIAIQLGVVIVVMGGYIVLLGSGAFGYSQSFPVASEVKALTIVEKNNNTASTLTGTFLNSINDYSYLENDQYYDFTQEESIAQMIEMQKKYDADFADQPMDERYTIIEFRYELKNGKTCTRSYYVGETDYSSMLMATPEYKESEPFIKGVTVDDVLYIDMMNYDYDEYEESSNHVLKPERYYDAIVQDYMEMTADDFEVVNQSYYVNSSCFQLGIYVVKENATEKQKAALKALSYEKLNGYYSECGYEEEPKLPFEYAYVNLTANCKRTIALLEKDGLIPKECTFSEIKAENVESMQASPFMYRDANGKWPYVGYYDSIEKPSYIFEQRVLYYSSYSADDKFSSTDTKSIKEVIASVDPNADQAGLLEKNKKGFAVWFNMKNGTVSRVYYVESIGGKTVTKEMVGGWW